MRLLAASLAGVSAYLAVGYITGFAPNLRWRIDRERSRLSERQVWLMQAGAQLSPGQFLLWSTLLGAFAFLVGFPPPGIRNLGPSQVVLRSQTDSKVERGSRSLAGWASTYRRFCANRNECFRGSR